jgi:UDP-N-acetylglucosamine--N-acetylmuramyl-(pentapeptide) pyrophosphoryl-undecaprenol N-acetylglucosamine transferase
LSRFVAKIATTVPESARYFRKGQTVTTGYPLREEITSASREAAIEHFGLDERRKTILVTGGSRGARTINIAIVDCLAELLEEKVQILHITGKLDYERTQEQVIAQREHPHYHLFDYLDSQEMGLAFAAADIILGRSGASALGEFLYFGAASVLAPYPFAWRYQRVNADWIAERGAGIRIDDEKMAEELLLTLQNYLGDDLRLKETQDCARALYQGNGAENLTRELLSLAGE